MYLGKPSFSLSFGLEEVKKLVSEVLKKKNWHEFKQSDITLSYVPYYIFFYDAFFEEKTEDGEKKISETQRGRLALDATSAEIDEEVSEELEGMELTRKTPNAPIEVERPSMNQKEAEKIAAIKTASFLGLHTRNIITTQMQMIYHPMWIIGIEVAEGNFELQVSGTNGMVFGEEEIPERKKGLMEITKETIYELKSPKTWGKYSIETGKTIAGSSLLRKILLNKWLITIILILILIYIIFFLQLPVPAKT
ncbi:MAG: hypothetical protein PHD95_05065 [Candidatus ainarchaeum sp.]|nr:hypothetical protein [Candidatus ainarchaeum sp.]